MVDRGGRWRVLRRPMGYGPAPDWRIELEYRKRDGSWGYRDGVEDVNYIAPAVEFAIGNLVRNSVVFDCEVEGCHRDPVEIDQYVTWLLKEGRSHRLVVDDWVCGAHSMRLPVSEKMQIIPERLWKAGVRNEQVV